jgi:glycosyltransferase involved in cell wall biosynthesis
LIHLLFFQRRLSVYAPQEQASGEDIPVSVIISARNEAKNLTENLPAILEQDYPQFEVVVVNDCSFDGSEEILKSFSQKYSRLKVVTVTEHPRFKTGKKFALTMGIKAAAHEHLLFTDADCINLTAGTNPFLPTAVATRYIRLPK